MPGAPSALPGQAGRGAPPLPEDPAVRTGRLPNGLTYFIAQDPNPAHRIELRLVVNAGSLLESHDQRGLAHVLEHMAFDGSAHFPRQTIWTTLGQVGMRVGADINAQTSYDETVYRLSVPTDSAPALRTALQVLADWAHGLDLDSSAFVRERQVVTEEWRLHHDAQARLRGRAMAELLAGSRYARRPPIGVPALLHGETVQAVRRFYHDWYRPDLEAVVIVGEVNPMSLETRVRRLFGVIPAAARPLPRDVTPPAIERDARAAVVTDPEAVGGWVTLASEHRHRPIRTAADLRGALIARLANDMLDARLRESARRPAAPYLTARMAAVRLTRDLDARELRARTGDAGQDAADSAVAALAAEAARAARDGFTSSELARAKRTLRSRARELAALGPHLAPAALADALVRQFLGGAPVPSPAAEAALIRRLLPTITLADVRRSARDLLADSGEVVVAAEPASARTRPSPQSLLEALRHPPVLAEYADSAGDAPLLSHEPTPGRVVSVVRVDSIGAKEWTLANGIRVILKPTAFGSDRILVTSYRDGGISLAPDSDLVPAVTAVPMASASGLGAYDASTLRQRLEGRSVRVGSLLGAYGEGVWASGSARDESTLFQLLYLELTAPRLDSGAYQQYARALQAALARRALDPAAAYRDTLALVLASHAPRVRLLNALTVAQLDPAKSLAFLRSRFASAAGFTFVIVGAFEPRAIRPLVERYLGGLPAVGVPPRWRDTGVRAPNGVVVRAVRKGLAPRAATTLVFLGAANETRQEATVLDALAGMLQQRLWVRLREQLGGVYGVEVTAEQQPVPRPTYRITLQFGASPRRLGELTRAVFAEVVRLQRDGPTGAELARYQAQARRAWEAERTTDRYWLERIARYDQRGWPLADLAHPVRAVDALTRPEIQAAAQRYLDPSHYVHVSLLPADPTD